MLTKKILLGIAIGVVTLIPSFIANAAAPGFYVGVQGGYGDTHFGSTDVNASGRGKFGYVRNRGLTGRIFAGYQFNPMWAAELGYTRFNDTRFSNGTDKEGNPLAQGTIQEHALDLVAKGTWPLMDKFNVYVKGGAAAIEVYGKDTVINDFGTRIHPTFGAGISYEINHNVPVDLSWTRIQKWGGEIPNADFIALGIAYKF